MKRLLNDPVMNDTGWPINRKVKQDTRWQHCEMHWSETTPFSLSTPHPQCPYLDSSTYDDKGQAKCFSSRNSSRFLNKTAVNQLQTALTRRPKNWAWACLHWLSTRQTRMAMVHEVTLFSVYKITLPVVRIELTRLLFWRCTSSLQGLLFLCNRIARPPFAGVKRI